LKTRQGDFENAAKANGSASNENIAVTKLISSKMAWQGCTKYSVYNTLLPFSDPRETRRCYYNLTYK